MRLRVELQTHSTVVAGYPLDFWLIIGFFLILLLPPTVFGLMRFRYFYQAIRSQRYPIARVGSPIEEFLVFLSCAIVILASIAMLVFARYMVTWYIIVYFFVIFWQMLVHFHRWRSLNLVKRKSLSDKSRDLTIDL
jgi:hypothetical protein